MINGEKLGLSAALSMLSSVAAEAVEFNGYLRSGGRGRLAQVDLSHAFNFQVRRPVSAR